MKCLLAGVLFAGISTAASITTQSSCSIDLGNISGPLACEDGDPEGTPYIAATSNLTYDFLGNTLTGEAHTTMLMRNGVPGGPVVGGGGRVEFSIKFISDGPVRPGIARVFFDATSVLNADTGIAHGVAGLAGNALGGGGGEVLIGDDTGCPRCGTTDIPIELGRSFGAGFASITDGAGTASGSQDLFFSLEVFESDGLTTVELTELFIPEPASFLLGGGALIALALYKRKSLSRR